MKVGDKVICIYKDIIVDGVIFGSSDITINKVYDLISVKFGSTDNWTANRVMVKTDSGINSWYFSERFQTIKEMRKLKLKRLEDVQSEV